MDLRKGSSSDTFDYSKCQYAVSLMKKGLITSCLRYIYIMNDKMIICKNAYQKQPHKIMQLKPEWKVKWIYENNKKSEDQQQQKTKKIGFKLYTNGEYQREEYYGNEVILSILCDFFAKQIFLTDFLDDFDILKKIGKGKYAKVYKVRNRKTNEFFAVKYLHKEKLKQIEDAQKALFNELTILRAVNHPNCIKLYSTYEDKHGYYILTELLESEKSLQDELQRFENPQFNINVTRHLMTSILKGIEYCHQKGIMHRDLKPQNIMFGAEEQVGMCQLKIIDFGLAQFVNDNNYIYVHVGTPGYVAPEILANESEQNRYNEKCDVFSIGVIFHILLTGRSLFPGKKFQQVLEKNKLCKIDLRGEMYNKINPEAMDLLHKMLEQEPAKRISAKEALAHPFFKEGNIKKIISEVFDHQSSQNQFKFNLKHKDDDHVQLSGNKVFNPNSEVKKLSQQEQEQISKQISKFQSEVPAQEYQIKKQIEQIDPHITEQNTTQNRMLIKYTKQLIEVLSYLHTNDAFDQIRDKSPDVIPKKKQLLKELSDLKLNLEKIPDYQAQEEKIKEEYQILKQQQHQHQQPAVGLQKQQGNQKKAFQLTLNIPTKTNQAQKTLTQSISCSDNLQNNEQSPHFAGEDQSKLNENAKQLPKKIKKTITMDMINEQDMVENQKKLEISLEKKASFERKSSLGNSCESIKEKYPALHNNKEEQVASFENYLQQNQAGNQEGNSNNQTMKSVLQKTKNYDIQGAAANDSSKDSRSSDNPHEKQVKIKNIYTSQTKIAEEQFEDVSPDYQKPVKQRIYSGVWQNNQLPQQQQQQQQQQQLFHVPSEFSPQSKQPLQIQTKQSPQSQKLVVQLNKNQQSPSIPQPQILSMDEKSEGSYSSIETADVVKSKRPISKSHADMKKKSSAVFPKTMNLLLDYFPEELFQPGSMDQNGIIKEKEKVYQLGLFLLFGDLEFEYQEPYISNNDQNDQNAQEEEEKKKEEQGDYDNQQQGNQNQFITKRRAYLRSDIDERLQAAEQEKQYEQWFIKIIKQMLQEDLNKRPLFSQFIPTFNDNVPQQ